MFKKLFFLKLAFLSLFIFSSLSAIKFDQFTILNQNSKYCSHMEDVFVYQQRDGISYFGVYDDHGGKDVADYLTVHLHRNIFEKIKENTISTGRLLPDRFPIRTAIYKDIREAFLKTDEDLRGMRFYGGACAITALIKDRIIYVANLGDCRAVLCRKGEAVELSSDHNPGRPDEKARIEALGEKVSKRNPENPRSKYRISRTWIRPAFSRAFGDFSLKRIGEIPIILSEPEIKQHTLSADDEFLILASDGLWDRVSSEDAVRMVKSCFGLGGNCKKAAEFLVRMGIRSRDNITVTVIRFIH